MKGQINMLQAVLIGLAVAAAVIFIIAKMHPAESAKEIVSRLIQVG